jgi:Molybdopterin-binding domain of aldehyde dehydrogenase
MTRGYGEAGRAFAEAPGSSRPRSRHTGVPLETRGLVADWDAGRRRLTIWGATLVAHYHRTVLSRLLGAPDRPHHLPIDRFRTQLRRPRRLLPGGLPGRSPRSHDRPAREVGRGPRGAPRGHQPRAGTDPRRQGRLRRRRAAARSQRRDLARQGQLLQADGRPRRRHHARHPPRPVPPARLRGDDPRRNHGVALITDCLSGTARLGTRPL